MAVRAGLEAAKASISRQQDMEQHERAATHDMLQALSAQARETEAKALLQHQGAMAAMLASQQAQVNMMTSAELPMVLVSREPLRCILEQSKHACHMRPGSTLA